METKLRLELFVLLTHLKCVAELQNAILKLFLVDLFTVVELDNP